MNVRLAVSLRAVRPRESRATPTTAGCEAARLYVRAVRTAEVRVRVRGVVGRMTAGRETRDAEIRGERRRGVDVRVVVRGADERIRGALGARTEVEWAVVLRAPLEPFAVASDGASNARPRTRRTPSGRQFRIMFPCKEVEARLRSRQDAGRTGRDQ